MEKDNYSRYIFYILLFFTMILTLTVLKIASSLMIPLTISILLSFAAYPLLEKMNTRLHIPFLPGMLIMLLLTSVILFTIGNILISSLKTILSAYPKYESRFTSIYSIFANTFKLPFDEDSSLLTNLWSQLGVRSAIQNLAISLSSSLITIGKSTFTVILFMVFLLLEMKSIRSKADAAFEGNLSDKLNNIFSNTINEVTRYISIKFIISLITGFIVYLGTMAIRLEFSIVWGFIAFLFNFIPTFGSIISSSLTIIFSLLQFYPSWGQVIFTAVLMLSVNMILGNIIEPRWEGQDLGLSPFVILVSLSLWGFIWGFTGMILAVPLMVIIKICFENISYLQPISVFLGNKIPVKEKKDNDEENVTAAENDNPEKAD